MSPTDQLFWLVALHFVADFQLQSDFIAQNKSPGSNVNWPWVLSAHAAVHAAMVGFVLNPLFGLLEFITHWGLDYLKSKGAIGTGPFTFSLDQSLHIGLKLVWLGLFLAFPDLS